MGFVEAILVLLLGAAISWGVQRFISERKAKAAAEAVKETVEESEVKN